MGQLTTHVLDTTAGVPGSEINIELYRVSGATPLLISTTTTNSDGRTNAPVLSGDDFKKGKYQLVFHTAEYFLQQGIELPDVPFLDDVVIRFGIADENEHYHVPLLVSPYSFSTYRGS